MLSVTAVAGLPEVVPGDDLADLIAAALSSSNPIRSDDVLVIAHKIVSKAEGRIRLLAVPSTTRFARPFAQDPNAS